ncbi:type I methionyl aminopeptidase [Patescibacteria group bacterium]|nr:type I methionyl aminopeptidase [Patescibacteria group bacterium]
MAFIKTPAEIELMRQGGAILSRALQAVVDAVKPGVTMKELDEVGEQVLLREGAKPSFKGYKSGDGVPFPSTLCISVNDEIVHGLGTREIKLKEGDIVGLDIGCWYEGLCTDMAVTAPVGNVSPERKTLLRQTRLSLERAVEAVHPGGEIADIAKAVEEVIDKNKYGIVRALTGHGVGHAVHEQPAIPNFVSNRFPVVKIKEGMCLAIEPMITLGSDQISTDADGWSIRTEDGSDAAHFEVTLAVTESGVEILTPQPKINL